MYIPRETLCLEVSRGFFISTDKNIFRKNLITHVVFFS